MAWDYGRRARKTCARCAVAVQRFIWVTLARIVMCIGYRPLDYAPSPSSRNARWRGCYVSLSPSKPKDFQEARIRPTSLTSNRNNKTINDRWSGNGVEVAVAYFSEPPKHMQTTKILSHKTWDWRPNASTYAGDIWWPKVHICKHF